MAQRYGVAGALAKRQAMIMRLAFMGTPDFAVPTLDALHAAGHDIAAVYTQPPRPAGRGKTPRPSAVQMRAEALGLPVRTPASLKDADEQAAFAALGLDIAVVAAYGLILPRAVLEAPAQGCLNVHASLLPRWRGAAPVQRAILAGDVMTGVTIMQMATGLDTGPMLASVETPTAGKTAGQLTEELARLGAEALVAALSRLDTLVPVPQPEDGVTYAAKIGKEEAKLDFTAPADAVERQVRAFTPWPGAWCLLAGERVKILAADIASDRGTAGTVLDDALLIACGDGALRPTLIQRPGRGPMTAAELLRGFPVPRGSIIQ